MQNLILKIIFAVGFLILLFALPAYGSPTGSITIPTAQILDPQTLRLEAQIIAVLGGETSLQLRSQYGLQPGWEAGIDFYLSDAGQASLNFKYQIFTPTPETPAIAFGLMNLRANERATTYLVLSQTISLPQPLNSADIHLGGLVTGTKGELILGADRFVREGLLARVDYISGQFFSLGAQFQLAPDTYLLGSFMFPTKPDLGHQCLIRLLHCHPL